MHKETAYINRTIRFGDITIPTFLFLSFGLIAATMKALSLLGACISIILHVACPVLSLPPDHRFIDPQFKTVFQSSPRRPHHDPSAPKIKVKELSNLALNKRAGRPIGVFTMHALRTATYWGARIVLERLWLQIIREAQDNVGQSTNLGMFFEMGEIHVQFEPQPGESILWDVIGRFANDMLMRVIGGEENFYIAELAVQRPVAIGQQPLGQQVIFFIMGTPDTYENVRAERWAATIKDWARHYYPWPVD